MKRGEAVQGVPKNETVWLSICNDGNITHLIASDKLRQSYKLYAVNDGKAVYTKHKSSNPLELEKFI